MNMIARLKVGYNLKISMAKIAYFSYTNRSSNGHCFYALNVISNFDKPINEK